MDAITSKLPPSIFFHGTEDKNIPIGKIDHFVEMMVQNGNESKLEVFAGMGHGFFNYGNHGNVPYMRTLACTTSFLKEHQLLGELR